MYDMSFRQKGFTLVEIIVGMVVLSIAMVLLTVIIFPQAQRSVEPVLQTRAASLGQALLEEIVSKAFDENSHRFGGQQRCSEVGAPPCSTNLGFEHGETRATYNDVDDYHGLNSIADAVGSDLSEYYSGFNVLVDVCYSSRSGSCFESPSPEQMRYKRVEVTVTTPTNQEFTFATIRGNY